MVYFLVKSLKDITHPLRLKFSDNKIIIQSSKVPKDSIINTFIEGMGGLIYTRVTFLDLKLTLKLKSVVKHYVKRE